MLAHLKDITGPLLDPLQFAYRANRSVDDAVNMGVSAEMFDFYFVLGFCISGVLITWVQVDIYLIVFPV